MYLYLVQRTDRVRYDEYESWVIAAMSKKEALQEVSSYTEVTIHKIGKANKNITKGIIHSSFFAG